MLVLSRKSGETIIVGDEITVTMLEVRGNQVKLGINAPEAVAIHRLEVYERIKQAAIPSEKSKKH